MKASEFIRVFGLDISRMAVNECPPECDLDTVELKRLVESHELVELYKNTYGESARWFFIANYCQEHRIAPHQADVYDFVGSKYDSYVADVEGCQ